MSLEERVFDTMTMASKEERHIISSTVVQVPRTRHIPTSPGQIPVAVRLYKQTRVWFDGPEDYEEGPIEFVCGNSDARSRESVTSTVAVILSRMPIPQIEVIPILVKFFRKLHSLASSEVPGNVPIVVLIRDITVSFRGSAGYHDVVRWIGRETISYLGHVIRGGEVTGELIEVRAVRRIPAARSFVHGLEKFRLDSMEEAFIRDTPTCAVCLLDFAETAEELITGLPCKHHYHSSCIVLCLEITHLCPMCRCPMPTEEAASH